MPPDTFDEILGITFGIDCFLRLVDPDEALMRPGVPA